MVTWLLSKNKKEKEKRKKKKKFRIDGDTYLEFQIREPLKPLKIETRTSPFWGEGVTKSSDGGLYTTIV